MIYTFVENALKHGLLSKDGNKRLWIIVRKNNELNQIIIRDNGIGRKKSKQIKTTGTNKGIVIITNIIRAYNKLNNRKISFKVIDLEEGVEVSITL